jgi:hypothetical protein
LTGASLLALLSTTGRASAAGPSADDRETSRSLYAEGMELLDAHDYAGAERACGGAHALVKAPTSAACWARALEGLGRLVEARDVFLEAVHFPVAMDEPGVFTSARDASRVEADSLSKRIPAVTLVVSGAPSSSPLRVTIDGVSVPGETARLPRRTNPGTHTIVVAAPGFESTTVTVQAGEGEDRRVDVVLHSAPSTATAAEVPSARVKQPRAIALVAGGVGVAGLVFGIASGLAAQSKHTALAGECSGGQCPPSAQGEIDSFHSLRTLSTIGYVVGAAGIVGGVVLWLTAPTSAGPALGMRLDPTSARVVGAF